MYKLSKFTFLFLFLMIVQLLSAQKTKTPKHIQHTKKSVKAEDKDTVFSKRKTLIKKSDIPENKNAKDTLGVKVGRILCSMKGNVGWMLSNDNKWLSSPNRIPFEDDNYNSEYYEKQPLGTDNLSEIGIAEVSIKEKNYYALLLYDMKGYELEMKKDDDLSWKNFPCVEYYVIEKSELINLRLDSLKFGKKITQSIKYIYYGAFNNSYKNFAFEMKRHIEWNIVKDHPGAESKTDAYFQFYLFPVKLKTGNKVMRFNITMKYPPKGDKPEPTIDYRVFNYQFYEVPFDKWSSFISSLPKK